MDSSKCDLCDKVLSSKSNLKNHKWQKHDIPYYSSHIIYKCDQPGCDFESKTKGHVASHLWQVHSINRKGNKQVHKCDQLGCDFESKTKSNLTSHLWQVHSIDRNGNKQVHNCDQPGCVFETKLKGTVTTHLWQVHSIDRNGNKQIHKCDQPGCNFESKLKGTVTSHLWQIHSIDHKGNKQIHKCDQPECVFEAKRNGDVTRHMWQVHSIDRNGNKQVHKCDQPGCEFEAKIKSNLTKHLENVHDIGKYQCPYCLQNRNSSILYMEKKEKIRICRTCYKKATGQSSRVETEWSAYLDKHVGTNHLLASDKSLKSVGGCQKYRPDKLYTGLHLVEVDECDEYQHTRTSGNYSCDEKRISDIYDEEGIVGKTMVVIRWNPDSYRLPNNRKGNTKKMVRSERLAMHAKLKLRLRMMYNQGHLKDKIHVYYMFYNEDNERITKNIPYTLIYDETDFPEPPLTNKN